ncbi:MULTISPECIES: TetR/AcrR family transcriptional regulator [Clostridium]|uniref:Transcriptional regulator, TetR family n=1 Tax=Clostridium intestinale DSM 6191 TaxID=1121320 RepID=A0A1M5UUD2_9CLOT|nr:MULTISPECIES: TetR/AcrR family transcriptional regulator [Clostridium]SHH66555.1 transcriptional regulator, TetR family [Clostridium intestinale DSM 6191]
MNGYERRTEEKKKLILNTALDMFLRSGISNTSVSDIAKTAKVSKVTIFNYFQTKDNLAREALKIYFDQYISSFINIIESNKTFIEKSEEIFSLSAENAPTMMESDILSKEVWEDPLMQQIYNELVNESMLFLIKYIEQGKKEGIIDSVIPTNALISFISMWAALSNPGTGDASIEYILGVSKLFFFGIFGDKDNLKERSRLFKSYERVITGQEQKDRNSNF